jgi:hypothetical protein
LISSLSSTWRACLDKLGGISAFCYEQLDVMVGDRDPRDFDSLKLHNDRPAPVEPPWVEFIQASAPAPDDLVVLSQPSGWTPRRITIAAGVAAAAAAACGVWVALLRRQVRRQVRIIEGTLQAQAVADERRRIAREFHDTLEQGLAAVALRLDRKSEFIEYPNFDAVVDAAAKGEIDIGEELANTSM